jgi:hypothetical protein
MIILGNGFDLHHGLPTSFKQFRDYLLDEKMDGLVSMVDNIIGEEIDEGFEWNEYESKLNQKYLYYTRLYYTDQVYSLEKTNERFVVAFQEYLSKLDYRKNGLKINHDISEEFRTADLIISLNYTKTYERYGVNSSRVTHLHGKVSEGAYPIIGFHNGDALESLNEEMSYRTQFNDNIIHKSALAFKQNLRNLDEEINNLVVNNESKLEQLTVIGYSFGECDMHIIKMLSKLCKTYEIGPIINYKQFENYEKTKIKFFDYNGDSIGIRNRLYSLMNEVGDRVSTEVFGNSIVTEEKGLFDIEIIEY